MPVVTFISHGVRRRRRSASSNRHAVKKYRLHSAAAPDQRESRQRSRPPSRPQFSLLCSVWGSPTPPHSPLWENLHAHKVSHHGGGMKSPNSGANPVYTWPGRVPPGTIAATLIRGCSSASMLSTLNSTSTSFPACYPLGRPRCAKVPAKRYAKRQRCAG